MEFFIKNYVIILAFFETIWLKYQCLPKILFWVLVFSFSFWFQLMQRIDQLCQKINTDLYEVAFEFLHPPLFDFTRVKIFLWRLLSLKYQSWYNFSCEIRWVHTYYIYKDSYSTSELDLYENKIKICEITALQVSRDWVDTPAAVDDDTFFPANILWLHKIAMKWNR